MIGAAKAEIALGGLPMTVIKEPPPGPLQ